MSRFDSDDCVEFLLLSQQFLTFSEKFNPRQVFEVILSETKTPDTRPYTA